MLVGIKANTGTCTYLLHIEGTAELEPAPTCAYLDDVGRLLDVLFKDQHGGGEDVDVVLPRHLFGPSHGHTYVSE